MRQRLGDRAILGLALGLDVAGDAHPLAVRELFQEAWVDLLSELTAETPTVVLVEDLHWAEDPLLDLLERVSRDVRGPLLVIGTARPELLDRRPAWGGGRRNASLVWLDALLAGRVGGDARRARARRALGRDPAGARRARRGQSVLPRRAARGLRRDGHGGRGAARLGPGDPLGARRPARPPPTRRRCRRRP